MREPSLDHTGHAARAPDATRVLVPRIVSIAQMFQSRTATIAAPFGEKLPHTTAGFSQCDWIGLDDGEHNERSTQHRMRYQVSIHPNGGSIAFSGACSSAISSAVSNAGASFVSRRLALVIHRGSPVSW